MKKLRKFWFAPLAVLTCILLVAASPTPRKVLSETFTDWIQITGTNPMIYLDHESQTGDHFAGLQYRNYDDTQAFFTGAQGSGEDYTYYAIRGENSVIALVALTSGEVGIGEGPTSGVELDVHGELRVRGDNNDPKVSYAISGVERAYVAAEATGTDNQAQAFTAAWSKKSRLDDESMVLVEMHVPGEPTLWGNDRGSGATDLGKSRNDASQVASGEFSTIGGGRGNKASGTNSTIAGGSANHATNTDATVAGGANNRATSWASTIGGGTGNYSEGYGGHTIGGGAYNTITQTAYIDNQYSVVSGGYSNTVETEYSVIAGGGKNSIEMSTSTLFGRYNTISGGESNWIRGSVGNNPQYDTIGGGRHNEIFGGADEATIGGGYYNSIGTDGLRGTIGGGRDSFVGAPGGTVPGGRSNTVGYDADYGTAMGYEAEADDYAEVAMASGTDNARQSFLQSRFDGVISTTWQDLALDGANAHVSMYEHGVTFLHAQVVVQTADAAEVGIYELEAAIQHEDFETWAILYQSGTALYEDDTSWGVRVYVPPAQAQNDEVIIIQVRDSESGNDDVCAVASFRLTKARHPDSIW